MKIHDVIKQEGHINIETFMQLALEHYYSTRDPFGVNGDFTTAPEISQMFGEMIGVFLADAWMKMGSPPNIILAEAGPGRGTLMADILRGTKNVPGFHQAIDIHLIEISPALKAKQGETLRDYDVQWSADFEGLPQGKPLFLVANEFLDALPIRQFVFLSDMWLEWMVALDEDGELAIDAQRPLVEPDLPAGQEGNVFEISAAREGFVKNVAERIRSDQGIALFIDYGHDQSGMGDTLQAMKNHEYADLLLDVGEADITSHVDFGRLKEIAAPLVSVRGPVGQGEFLKSLGIDIRAKQLNKKDDAKRLCDKDQMGTLFRVIALCHDGSIDLAGF